MSVLLINGPNLNLLGSREPEIYGASNLTEIEAKLIESANEKGVKLVCFQSNAEHELVERIHEARNDGTQFILINPAAFTHTSVAIRDSLAGVSIPFIELHISNPHSREPFRHHSYFSDLAVGVIAGFGINSYSMALDAAINFLEN
jgi:3-dehydroquinate dehydratase-2